MKGDGKKRSVRNGMICEWCGGVLSCIVLSYMGRARILSLPHSDCEYCNAGLG